MHDLTGRDLDEVIAFLAAVDAGGFAGAGRQLERDASVLSRRVTALERRLGVRLLERTTRRIVPTEAGASFADRMRAALAAMTEAREEARAVAAEPRGVLRLTLPSAFGRLWVAPLLPNFLDAHPALRIEASYADRFVDLVAEGFDVGVRLGKLPDSGLIVRRLADSPRLVCAAPSYLAVHGAPADPGALAQHACLLFTGLTSFPAWHFERHGRSVAIKLTGRLRADDAESLIPAALAGQGVMIGSDWLVGPHLATGRLVRVLADWTVGGGGAISLVRPAGRLTPAKTRAFSDWIAARMGSPPWNHAGRS